jgi:hypothetical protein
MPKQHFKYAKIIGTNFSQQKQAFPSALRESV